MIEGKIEKLFVILFTPPRYLCTLLVLLLDCISIHGKRKKERRRKWAGKWNGNVGGLWGDLMGETNIENYIFFFQGIFHLFNVRSLR